LGGGAILTASITNEAVDELKLETGKRATVVVKATDVMIGVED
jgi:molybdopterin-binding protein